MISKVVCFVPALSQPRCIKRVSSLYQTGCDVYVYGYNRGKYDVNQYPNQVKVNILGGINDGDYLRKFKTIWIDTSRIINDYKNTDTLFYAFGYFHAFVCFVKHVKYIYEISDILYAYPQFKYIKPLLVFLDKAMIRKSKATIMTSGGFKDYLDVEKDNIFVIPNQVNRLFEKKERRALSLNSNKIRFGFVGSMRYESIYKFSEVIGRYFPKYTFTFYGGALGVTKDRINSIITRYSNVHYYGVYKNPDDLESIYREIDVVVACYDINSENERIAEPNKLYESLFFCKPILVSPNIYLSKRVCSFGCGYSIDASCEESIKRFVEGIKIEDLNAISQRELTTPLSEIVDNPETIRIIVEKCSDYA